MHVVKVVLSGVVMFVWMSDWSFGTPDPCTHRGACSNVALVVACAV